MRLPRVIWIGTLRGRDLRVVLSAPPESQHWPLLRVEVRTSNALCEVSWMGVPLLCQWEPGLREDTIEKALAEIASKWQLEHTEHGACWTPPAGATP